tara:strand:+ start:2574 stop:2915 length:342 start_codon:yes stop_codon:yes gene_type:complete
LPNALSSQFQPAAVSQSFPFQFCPIFIFFLIQLIVACLTFPMPHALISPGVRVSPTLFYFAFLVLGTVSLVLEAAIYLVQFLAFLPFLFVSALLLLCFELLFTIAPHTFAAER